jgi:hypothetical protein
MGGDAVTFIFILTKLLLLIAYLAISHSYSPLLQYCCSVTSVSDDEDDGVD